MAHADAGKTTMCEHFLLHSGLLKEAGSVDKGSAFTDNDAIEREKGISIRLSSFSFELNNCIYNVIDTPGHVDFSSEVEYALKAVDGIILLVSAVEGVQSQTISILKTIERLKIPFMIFINKVDRAGADTERVLDELRKETKKELLVCVQNSEEGLYDYLNHDELDEQFIEQLFVHDEELLEKYLEGGNIHKEEVADLLKSLVENCELAPVLMGSAKNNEGISELLEYINCFFPEPDQSHQELSAVVYKIEEDANMGLSAHIRVLSGTLKNKQNVKVVGLDEDVKTTRIQRSANLKYEIVEELSAGEIGVITGISELKNGDIIGTSSYLELNSQMEAPLMTVDVKAVADSDYSKLSKALIQLNLENPRLNFMWHKDEREFHIDVMGDMQMEIIEKTLRNRFSLEASCGRPQIRYMETVASSAQGYVCYWMPKPCWAIITFLIEPTERGAGVQYKSEVPVSELQRKYQNEVEKTVPVALKQGLKGWPVTDVKVTMIAAEEHQVHTRPSDFVIATPMGIMDGLVNAGTEYLEPIMAFKVVAEESLLGEIVNDVVKMRGEVDSPYFDQNQFYLEGRMPLKTALEYPAIFNSRTSGKGRFHTEFTGYQKCEDEYGNFREYKGINPLDTAKYILKARKAITESFK